MKNSWSEKTNPLITPTKTKVIQKNIKVCAINETLQKKIWENIIYVKQKTI